MRELDRRVLLLAAHAQTCFGEAPDEAVSHDNFAYLKRQKSRENFLYENDAAEF